VGELLEVARGQLAVRVPIRDRLPLLGEAEAAAHGVRGLGQDRAVRGAAAPADRTPPPVEEGEGDAVAAAERGQRPLGEVQLPVRGEVAAVLVRVAVPDHDRLRPPALVEVARVGGVREEALHDRGGGVEVLHRLEQRHHVEGVCDPGVLRQEQDREDVARPPGHAHDAGVDGGRPHPRVGPADEAGKLERVVRGRAEVEDGGGEGPRAQDLARQDPDALLLGRGRVVEARAVAPEDLRERFGVAAGVLAQVQRREVEAEDLGLGHEGREPARGQPLALVGPQALLHEAEVPEEGPGRSVGARARAMVGPPGSPRGLERRPELAVDERHLLAVGLADVALGRAARLVGEERRVGGHALRELGRHPVLLGRAQQSAHPVQGAPVEPQDHRPVLPQRLLGHGRGDVRVAVAVAADPAPEAEEERHVERALRVLVGEGAAELGRDLGGEVEERRLEVVEAVAHLVDYGGAAGARGLGLPERDDLLAEEVGGALRLVGGRRPLVEEAQGVRDPPLLGEDGPAGGLGGMGGQHRPDLELPHQLLHLVGREPLLLQLPHRRGQRLAHGLSPGARVPSALAEDAHPLLLLGQVDELEVAGEGLHHDLRLVEGHLQRPGQQTLARVRAPRAVGLGQGPDLLHEVEERPSFLLDDRLAEEVPEEVDLLAQRIADLAHLSS
jgi:hypothetical protein